MKKDLGNFLIITPETPHEVEEVVDGERISLIISIENKDVKSISKKSIL